MCSCHVDIVPKVIPTVYLQCPFPAALQLLWVYPVLRSAVCILQLIVVSMFIVMSVHDCCLLLTSYDSKLMHIEASAFPSSV